MHLQGFIWILRLLLSAGTWTLAVVCVYNTLVSLPEKHIRLSYLYCTLCLRSTMPGKKKSTTTVAVASTAVAGSSGVQQPGRKRRRKQKDRTPPAANDDTIDDLNASQDSDAETSTVIVPSSDTIATLRQQVENQQVTINRLSNQVDFLLQFLGIKANTSDAEWPTLAASLLSKSKKSKPLTNPTMIDQSNQQSTSQPGGSSQIPQQQKKPVQVSLSLPQSLSHAVVTAVYCDMKDRERRSRNVVVSGFKKDQAVSDDECVKELFRSEFPRPVEVVRSRRLGPERPGRVQPLLVSLKTDSDAQYLVTNARLLRLSSDHYTRSIVYINADVTKAEAQAAYLERCERRKRAAARAAHAASGSDAAPIDSAALSAFIAELASVNNPPTDASSHPAGAVTEIEMSSETQPSSPTQLDAQPPPDN